MDYHKTSIKFSRVEKKLTIQCPRVQQQFQNEKPLFVVDPDKLLFHFLSPNALVGLSGQQFLKADRVIQDSCGDFSQAPPLIGLKNSLMFFFQQREVYYYQFLLPKGGVHGMVLINKRLYDYENRVPVVDLAFCFLEESFVHVVAPIWVKMSSGQTCNLKVSDAEYELLKDTFYYFAERTNATCYKINAKSRLHLLTKHGVQKYFTRAVVSLLLYDPDVYWQFINTMKQEGSRGSANATSACSSCGNLSKHSKFCASCRMVKYCSRDCQRDHWKVHKLVCTKEPPKQTIDDMATTSSRGFHSEPKEQMCNLCNNTGMLKKCSQCGEVHYCGRDCQTKHWPIHKAECKRLARAP